MLYFDHNATTPLLPEAREAWIKAAEEHIGNPSSPHRLGSRADAALEHARETLAGLLACNPGDIVWTSGATEANNMVLHHFACTLAPEAEIWVSAIEHPCVLEAARYYASNRCRLMPATRSGVLDLDWLKDNLARHRPGLMALMAANNETGVLQPWREALDICRDRGVPLFCDAVQWLGKLPAKGLGRCDYVSGCAHKFGGPKGVGFLKCAGKCQVEPLLCGGPQEGGRRAGTENVPGVLGMLAALEARERMLESNRHLSRLAWRKHFEKGFLAQLPGSEIVARDAERLWNTVLAVMPDLQCQQRWVVKLDRFGCAVSTGSACASGKEQASHVLTAMGYASGEAGRVLRFSSGWETGEADWESLLQGLRQAQSALGV